MAQSESIHGLHAVAITDRVEGTSRRIARIWGVLAVGVFAVLAATVGLPHGPDLESWERLAQLLTLGIIVIAVAVAWKWEGIGGGLLLVAAASLGILAALQHQPLVAFIPAAVFLVPAVAFLIAWNRTRSFASVIVLATVVIMVLTTGSMVAQAMYEHGYGAAHPESSLPPPPDSPVAWLWTGGVTDTEVTIVARIEDATHSLVIATDPGGVLAEYPGEMTRGVWRFHLDGLTPATEYRYHFEIDGTGHPEREGIVRTFPSGPTNFTVAVGSCARLGSNGRVYETILGLRPDLFLVPGDFFYADYMETADQFTEAFATTLTQPAQAALLAAVPIAYVWDDHDYGGNDSDSTASTRQMARDAYSAFVPHYPLTESGSINQTFAIGRVQFLLLDNRSERSPKNVADGPDKTMLGTTQLAWLEDQLLPSNDRYQLTIIVSSVPWIATAEDGADHWGGYATERQTIADFIADNNLDNILMVAGDAHMVAIDDGTNTDFSATGNASFPLLHAAALDRPGSVKGGPYSEGAFPGGGQFGLIAVEDDGGNEIAVEISGLDWTKSTIVAYSFTVAVPEVTP